MRQVPTTTTTTTATATALITLMVTVREIEEGEWFCTLRGSEYERDYEVWRDRKGIKGDLSTTSPTYMVHGG